MAKALATQGKDGSRAFATGDFTPAGLTDDVSDLESTQCAAIANWVSFYEKDNKRAAVEQAHSNAQQKLYPTCSSRWAQGEGGQVWCDNSDAGDSSAGKRVPRKIPKSPSASQWGGGGRCACFTIAFAEGHAAQLEQYEIRAAALCLSTQQCWRSGLCAGIFGRTLDQLDARNIDVERNRLHCDYAAAAVVAHAHLMLYRIMTNTSAHLLLIIATGMRPSQQQMRVIYIIS
eukprot:1667-Heterococcus_DN1.PRE.4